jgi:hypothetical protein
MSKIKIVPHFEEFLNSERIMHPEIGYDGKKELKWVGTISHDLKEVRPTHGYFPKHPTSKKTKKIADDLGYEYNSR